MKNEIFPLDGDWALYTAENRDVTPALLCASCANELENAGLSAIPGRVPGNFELDLERAGLLPELFFGENILKAQELENRHLWYTRSFESPFAGGADTFLCFDGIDTFADIYLNGEKIGSADNMLIAHEFNVPNLRAGKNEITVHITPAVLEARKTNLEAGSSSCLPYNWDSLGIRKAPYMFGWDIMPRAVSGGIWRSVRLEKRPPERIDELYIYTSNTSRSSAGVRFYYKVWVAGDFIVDYTLKLSGACKDSVFTHLFPLRHTEGTLGFRVENPYLWWPRDMGDPDLYAVKAELCRNGETIAEKSVFLGLRTVRLERTSLTDKDGGGEFCFYINGERLFARGTNWVPLDAFPSRNPERLPRALELLYEANCNMVRCWGGNTYESDEFYSFCDTHGITVWQDFCMGCAVYPQTGELCAALEKEAVFVVKALRQHASLVLWAGDNECDSAYAQWGPIKRDPNENVLTRRVLPSVLSRHDPFRPYLPSSPYIDPQAFASGRDGDTPENHLWGPRDYYKGRFYNEAAAHFASETGYHGCPSPASVEKFISEDKLWPWKDNTQWLVHSSSMEKDFRGPYAYRIALMASQVDVLFDKIPDGLAAFALASQISQSEALKFFIERFRMSKWRRTGILWWNLLDGWPQFSDAVVDYYYVKKLAFHTVKRVAEPVCLMLGEPQDGAHTLYGANEFLEDKQISYKITGPGGEALLAGSTVLEKNSTRALAALPYAGEGYKFYVIAWTLDGKEHKNHYISGPAPYPYEQTITDLRAAGLLDLSGF